MRANINAHVAWREDKSGSPHLLEARHEPAQGVGHEAARQADVDQLEAGVILEGLFQGGVQFFFRTGRVAAASQVVGQGRRSPAGPGR